MGSPRTGTTALQYSMENSGLNVCPGDPFYIGSDQFVAVTNRHDHCSLAAKVFTEYDGFKIILNHSLQILEMAEKNDAKLILTRRHDFLSFMASYIGLLNHNIGPDPYSYEGWTSSGKQMIYKPIPFVEHTIDKFLHYNHMIDEVYSQHKNYLTTIHYEDPSNGIADLENYFDREIDLQLAPNVSLSEYFVNHEDFERDMKKILKDVFKDAH